MNRGRTTGGPLLPRSGGGRAGIAERFGGPGPIAALVGVGLLLLIIIVVVVSRCGGKAAAQQADCSRKPPAPPTGYTYAAKYCVTSDSKLVGQKANIQDPVTDKSSTRGLSLFAYDNGKWTRLAGAQITQDGSYAINSQSIEVPRAFAVLRRTGTDFQVLGAVPRNAAPGPDAVRLMTESVPQAYTPAADGSIAGGPVAAAPGASFGVMPAVVAETGTDAQAVNSLLADDSRRNAHVDRIVAEADRGNFDGVEIDYPAVDASLKGNFTSFVQALAQRLHASKRKLVLRLPLPRREGNNWNTTAYDWPQLAKSADQFVLAAEYDQSIYRTRVPDAIKYLMQQVGDSRKLILEVTPYSEERSEQGTVRTLTTLEALSIAGQITVRDSPVVTGADVTVSADNINREGAGGLQWTPQAVVAFQYSNGSDQRTVWVENPFSAGYKLEYVQLYKLGGVQVANASADPALTDIWPAVEQYQSAGAPVLQQPNPQVLRPQWLADGKPIPDAGNRAVITWHAPADAGRHTLGVVVSDGIMRVANTVAVNVVPGTPGAPGTSGASGTPRPGATAPATSTRAPASATRPAAAPTRTSTSTR